MAGEQEFVLKPATRERTPLLIGIVGPSGAGKTFSALRLATGIQRVTGGDIHGIDTEGRRMLHYADKFKFHHLDFKAPFGSLRYLAAIQHCATKGAGVIVVDSQSHEHDGEGGYLDSHEKEVERLVRHCGFGSAAAAQIPAWSKPAEARRKLLQGIIHLGVNAIFCFRAKEKVDLNGKDDRGKKTVKKLGWMPIAGDSFVYEMTMKCLLMPGSDGVPEWHPQEAGERAMCKLPAQFRNLFKPGVQLSEDIGQRLAEWAAGVTGGERPEQARKTAAADLLATYAALTTPDEWDAAERARADGWKSFQPDEKVKLKEASNLSRERVELAVGASGDAPGGGGAGNAETDPPGPADELFDNDGGDAAAH